MARKKINKREEDSRKIGKKLDASCRAFLLEKSISAWIMKGCMFEYKSCTHKEIAAKYIEDIFKKEVFPKGTDVIVGNDTTDKISEEGARYFDVLFYATTPASEGKISLIINFEPQNKVKTGYPLTKRGIYYGSRLISTQYGKFLRNSKYGELRKVYSVWICPYPAKKIQNTIVCYEMNERIIYQKREVKSKERATVCKPLEARENYDLLTVVLIYLGDPDETDNPMLRMLDTAFSEKYNTEEKWRILGDEFEIPATETLKGAVKDMGSYSDSLREFFLEKGEKQGEKKGIIKGEQNATVKYLRELMHNLGWTLEKAMGAIGLPISEEEVYRKLLAEK